MKNFFTFLFFCCLFSSCSDDDQATMTTPSTTLASRPEANSSFDNSYKGIYKGIVIGNVSGAIYVDILNDGKTWAKLETDHNETYVLENMPVEGDKNTSSDLRKYRFANENVSFELKLDDYGTNITVSNFKYFSDNTSVASLVKEKSNSLIKCYTGKYKSDGELGSVNFTSDARLKVKGLSREMNSILTTKISGEINAVLSSDGMSKNNGNTTGIYHLKANLHIGQIIGDLDGYKFDGRWMIEGDQFGDWDATRIL